MRILVTGASGLLGLNLALAAAQEHTVIGLTNSHNLKTEAFQVLNADLLAPGAVERLLDQAQPDWVIHCAALANVDACESEPLTALKMNSEIPAQLAKHVARGGARLIHVSTDAVFDGRRGNYSEADTPNPLGAYARSKLEGERGVAEANPEAMIARVNLFGWSLSGKRSLGEFFFYHLSAGKQVMGFTDVYFCPLLVNDLAPIFLKMLALNLHGLFHTVSSECLTKYEFGVRVAARFGLDASLVKPTLVADSGLVATRSPNLTLRTEKLSTALGAPLPSVSAGLERFYTLYQQGYPQWVRGLGRE
jgi:dTDP-4-dehydrorhamnose reductase